MESIENARLEVRNKTDIQLRDMFSLLSYPENYLQMLKKEVMKQMQQRGLFNIYKDER
ncbi:unnamed protein product [marine sediment metagenome]|uniref:Uncharacterized protein n=1 Tax=marine sediment metagenome TaxID=412755 RepID=X1HMJ9_9ZZZZ